MQIPFRPALFFLVASLVCLIIALLLEVATISGSDWQAWMLGGLVAFVAAHLFP